MRLLKAVTVCAAACALLSQPATAQRANTFDNSWFWGLKTGATFFSTPGTPTTSSGSTSASVPTWGLDWMITRKHGGLYISADESFFNRTLTATDASSATGTRQIKINGLHHVDFAGLVFPARHNAIRPYAGIGAAISILGSAVAQADSLGGAPSRRFIDDTENKRSRASVLIMGGVQFQGALSHTAFFVQETVLPSGPQFLINSPMSFLEVGIRYNFGSSIESAH